VATGSLNEPGFIQVRAVYRANAKAKAAPIFGLGGAAIDPTEIKRSLPVPDDFDAFWDGMKKKLAAVPVEPKLVSVQSPLKDIESFDVTAPALGLQISGYMSKPVGAKPKSLPIILTVHGAGVSDSSLGGSASWASKGFLAMDMNAHGLPNGKPKQFYADLYAGPMNPYRYEFRNDREKAYFTGMMLRLIRGIDVLTSQPEWDGKHVVVSGASQGGYQAIAAAGLDARVTFFAAGVPAGCDHSGMLVNRIAGWPKIVPMVDGKPDNSVVETFRYLDCMNFATRTKAAGAYFTVGFIDTTCPPTSIYATYNQLNISKEIYNDIPSGHSHSPAAREGMTKAVMKHVGK
jgi:cephalosporin-C deacetylase-like acetyl esterase